MAISYHADIKHIGQTEFYGDGFKFVNTCDFERLVKCISKFTWSPCVWEDGVRLAKKFHHAVFCVLDFDSGELTLAQALNIWCDAKHIIGLTKSHQKFKNGAPPCDRFRVLLEFEKPIACGRHYKETMRHYVDMYGADPACIDSARYFWPCRQIVSVQPEGFKQDILDPPPPPMSMDAYRALVAAKSLQYQMTERLPKWITRFFAEGAPIGMQHRTAHGVAVELIERGWECSDILNRLNSVPMTRPWGNGEIERIIQHSIETVKNKGNGVGEKTRGSAENSQGHNLSGSREGSQSNV
jgi:hypothetical protein